MSATQASSRLKVAAVQTVSGCDAAANLQRGLELARQAAAGGARLILLPEYFCLMGRQESDKVAIREADGEGQMQAALAAFAAEVKVWLLAGTIPLAVPDPAKVANTVLVYGPDGKRHARYDKIHLFRYASGREEYDEARTISAGDTPVVAEVDADGARYRVGLSVCYDLRFPELYRAMGADKPLDLIMVPAAFTYGTGKVHWEILLRARAIENQCYVLASAQGGTHENGRRTWGHSMLIDPWGEIVAQLPEGEGLVAGEIDTARTADIRAKLPALEHRVL
ncbi:MAG: carbon-nitrogen hydrolase family protein [Candidatus Protistobacter heckmanni]|nr:carbon-nitrogen hydrolase family protein [Candidatus Protistobacter heckmanni]